MTTSNELFSIFNILINKYKNNNISFFEKEDILEDIHSFLRIDKINDIFNDVNIDEMLDLYIKCGYLNYLKTDNKSLYIINSNQSINTDESLEKSFYSYCKIKEICDKYNNLVLYYSNPNDKYTILNGKKDNHKIKWTLFTDGNIIKNNLKLIKGTKHSFNSPFTSSRVFFDDTDFNFVNVDNSSYVLRQNIIDNEIVESILYTKILDEEKIDLVVSEYCKKK